MKKIILYCCLMQLIACVDHSDLNIFNSLELAIEDASLKDRKILLVFDFLGNPTNSAKALIYDEEVTSKLNKFTVVLLNVDEPKGKGELNKELQITMFGTSTQPTYYVLDKNGKVIKGPLGYCKKSEFLDFIK